MKIILIHGYKADSNSNFFPWLRDELHSRGHEVIAPDLPNPNDPDAEEWIKTLLEEVGTIDDQTIVVGYSLGAPMALRFLEAAEMYSTPRGCVLIAPPWKIKDEKFRGFFISELDFDVLMWKATRFVIIHSKDDKIIPIDHAKKYEKVLHAKLLEREHGEGHYQGEKYPVVLAVIDKIINEPIDYHPGKGIEDQFEGII